jgi:aconitate hydratase
MQTTELRVGSSTYRVIDLCGFAGDELSELPWVKRILLENIIRSRGGKGISLHQLTEIDFFPTRVLMHDTTFGPALVDIAASRSALSEAGGDPSQLNPVLQVDVSTDHSLAVDYYGTADAVAANQAREFERNAERYRFTKWATAALQNLTVHPPGTGIMHTINLERLATVITTRNRGGEQWAFPETLVGTDSHTPMINGIGVLGWGVGGLEAESVMLGMPITMRAPKVVGVRLTGVLQKGVMVTDAALSLCARLRQEAIGGKFLEFFGPGVSSLSGGERAAIANMAPEYGSATTYFPIDENTLRYLAQTGRSAEHIDLILRYAQTQGLWFDPQNNPTYDQVINFNLSDVEIGLAGPRRPQDFLHPGQVRTALAETYPRVGAPKYVEGPVPNSAVAIAAITSCTNTSEPRLLVAAGLLARNARNLGLRPPPWVKTSLAPGSPTAERYLKRLGLLADLEALGFGIVGYGCTTCIGNSGPLNGSMTQAINAQHVAPVAVLSGNRNFPGRVHNQIEMAFLASPPLVVAYALAGVADIDISADPIGRTANQAPVRLSDIWPAAEEIDRMLVKAVLPSDYSAAYDEAEASRSWKTLQAPSSDLFPWDPRSNYIRRPPFARVTTPTSTGHFVAYPLLILGDDITTDHISPAGAIPLSSQAAHYLIREGENPDDLNVFSARRGNWEVMVRGLFTNKNVKNLLMDGLPPGTTIHIPSGRQMSLLEAAEQYKAEGSSVILIAGERYGMGSSRDWAAKGVCLLGVRAVCASGFESIHRSNLVNMGVLPLKLHTPALRLELGDMIEINAPPERLVPEGDVAVRVHRVNGTIDTLTAHLAIETHREIEVLIQGGLIPHMLQNLLANDKRPLTSQVDRPVATSN